jgi:hypothetical protein
MTSVPRCVFLICAAEIGVGRCGSVEREAPIECWLFHYAHNGPNCGVPVVLDAHLIVRLLEVHPRELEERCEGVYFIPLRVSHRASIPNYRKTRPEDARPPLVFECHTRANFSRLVVEGRSQEGAGTTAARVDCGPVCFGVHHCAVEALRQGEGATVLEELQVKVNNGERSRQTWFVVLGSH